MINTGFNCGDIVYYDEAHTWMDGYVSCETLRIWRSEKTKFCRSQASCSAKGHCLVRFVCWRHFRSVFFRPDCQRWTISPLIDNVIHSWCLPWTLDSRHMLVLVIWCGLCAGGILGPYFYVQTVNSEWYLHFLTTWFIPDAFHEHWIQDT